MRKGAPQQRDVFGFIRDNKGTKRRLVDVELAPRLPKKNIIFVLFCSASKNLQVKLQFSASASS